MDLHECIVDSNIQVSLDVHVMELRCYIGDIKPGQFVMVKVNSIETLLRRPFSIYRAHKDSRGFSLLYKVAGRGTHYLSKVKTGGVVNVLGPLGRPFPVRSNVTAVLLSRGVGIASLAYLGYELKKNNCNVITIASFKSRVHDIVSNNEYISSFSDKIISLYDEDGTSELSKVEQLLNSIRPDIVFTCGSKRFVKMLQKYPFEAYVSWEERMGCGLGACLSCVVKTVHGYKLTCKDGPVFNVREIVV